MNKHSCETDSQGRPLSRRGFLGTAAGFAVLPEGGGGVKALPTKRIAFVAGVKSHRFGEHAHNAGCLLLAKCLHENVPGVETVVHQNGWPDKPSFFDGVSTVVLFMDGGDRHPILPHLNTIDELMKQGVGLAVLAYALVVPKGEPGNKFLEWIGGYYETYWSVNPFWTGRFDKLPEHPITRGVRPFSIYDEWYYHMRLREDLPGAVTPILTAVPPEKTRQGSDGPHSGNPFVRARKGQPEHVAWAYQRPSGGRGFGFTGGHYHWSWGQDDFRKLILNAVVWTAGLDVPREGIRSRTPTWEELMANQEGRMPEGFSAETARELIKPRSE